MTEKLKLEQLVAICVLMQGHDGITTKAPPYIFEKWESCLRRTSKDELLGLMDRDNAAKFRDYIIAWRLK